MSAYISQLRYRSFVSFHQSSLALLSTGMMQQTLGGLTALGQSSLKASIVDVVQRHAPGIYARFQSELGYAGSLNANIFNTTYGRPAIPEYHWQRMVGRSSAVLAAPNQGRIKSHMSGGAVDLYVGGVPINTRRIYATTNTWRGAVDDVRSTIQWGPMPTYLFVVESNLRELGFNSFADQVAAFHDELALWTPAVQTTGDYEQDLAAETVLGGTQWYNKRYQDFDNTNTPMGPVVPM